MSADATSPHSPESPLVIGEPTGEAIEVESMGYQHGVRLGTLIWAEGTELLAEIQAGKWLPVDGVAATDALEAAVPLEQQVPENHKAVLSWVGDDPERARAALSVEHQRPAGARPSVTKTLGTIIADAFPDAFLDAALNQE